MKKTKRKPVVVFDSHRAVYFGYIIACADDISTVQLNGMRHCYYYAAVEGGRGMMGLASHGPGKGSKVAPAVDCRIRDVTKILDATPAAVERWEAAKWAM